MGHVDANTHSYSSLLAYPGRNGHDLVHESVIVKQVVVTPGVAVASRDFYTPNDFSPS
jgi:hypothetical protein